MEAFESFTERDAVNAYRGARKLTIDQDVFYYDVMDPCFWVVLLFDRKGTAREQRRAARGQRWAARGQRR
jgi:hypothetical protein